MATVEEIVQSIRNALPFLHNLERGQRRKIHIYGGTSDGIEPSVNLQSAVIVSHNKTTDILSKCDDALTIFDQLTIAIAAVQATEFPDPLPIPVSETDWDESVKIDGEIGAASGEIVKIPSATALNLTVLPTQPKAEH